MGLPRRLIVAITTRSAAQRPQLCPSIACQVLKVGRRVGTKQKRTFVAIMVVRHVTHTIAPLEYQMDGPVASWSGVVTTKKLDAPPLLEWCNLIVKPAQQIGRQD